MLYYVCDKLERNCCCFSCVMWGKYASDSFPFRVSVTLPEFIQNTRRKEKKYLTGESISDGHLD